MLNTIFRLRFRTHSGLNRGFASLTLSLLLLACQAPLPPAGETPRAQPTASSSAIISSPSPSSSPPTLRVLTDDTLFLPTQAPNPKELKELLDSGLVAKYNELGFKLFKTIFAKEGLKNNIMISPLSIMLALAMVYNGASGETRAEMARVFAIEGIAIEDFNRLSSNLWRSLVQNQDETKVQIANSLWPDIDSVLKPSFIEVNRNAYQAQLTQLDFQGQPTKAAATINAWVEKRTNGLITKLLEEDDIREALLVLVNTVYFKANWSEVFEPKSTRPASFYLLDGTVLQHPMMPHTKNFPYVKKQNGTQILTKDYEGLPRSAEELQNEPNRSSESRYVMTFILPEADDKLAEEVSILEQTTWQNLQESLKKNSKYGNILMPKFQASYKGALEGYLSELGMEQLFDRHKATLHNMTDSQAFVSSVIHETKIDLNEKGTEAAAATAVVVRLPSVSYEHPQFEFKADHPFLYLIHDAKTGAVLFIGSLINPAAEQAPKQPTPRP